MISKPKKDKMLLATRKTPNVNIVLRIEPFKLVCGKEDYNGK